jgi:hypothetical protein
MDATVAGRPYPAGTYTIEPWADRILRDTLGAPRAFDDGEAHPLWGYIAAQNGIGVDIDGLMEPVNAGPQDGTMIASCDVELRRQLRVGVPYDVTGEIVGLERKVGRKTGPFDLFTFFIDLHEPDGAHAVRMTAVFVLPRRETANGTA